MASKFANACEKNAINRNIILSHKRVQCDQLHYAGGGKKHNYILEKKDSLIFLVTVFHSLDYKITALLLQEHIIDR